MESRPHIAAIPEAIKVWIPERTNSAYQRPHEKDQRIEKGSWKRLTSIKRLKYFQKEICVVPSHDFVFSVREEDRLIELTVCLLPSLLLPCPLLLSILMSLFSPDGVSSLSASPLSCSHTFSLCRPLLTFSVSMSVSLRRETQPRGTQDRLAANSGSRLVYGSGKLHCHISCFSAWN